MLLSPSPQARQSSTKEALRLAAFPPQLPTPASASASNCLPLPHTAAKPSNAERHAQLLRRLRIPLSQQQQQQQQL
eukprot:scaffold91889_cov19-Tisochrysis_lutea.AAC.2